METHRAKKSLGQHFLRSEGALAKIVAAGALTAKDTVLEIGPGRGVLTERLLATGAHVVAVEKDHELIPVLKERFAQAIKKKQLRIVEGDILDFKPLHYLLHASQYKVIANIPYYITGAIVRKFLEEKNHPGVMILLVQDEVARRVVASPSHNGTKDAKESLLSISVKAYGTPRYVAKVPRGAFAPAPKVDSAILAIEHISKIHFEKGDVSEKRFFDILRAGFAHKRKVLIKNLEEVAPKEKREPAFEALGLSKNVRAEDVPLATWLALCKKL